jgi:hypothetical protein
MTELSVTGQDNHMARRLWHRLEHLHAVIYFHQECTAALASLGLTDFWAGYFASRCAPLGPVGPGVVEAIYFNFAPGLVREWIPKVWAVASPETVEEARRRSAAIALSSCLSTTEGQLARTIELLAACVDAAPASGRVFFAANRDLPVPEAPLERLWQLCTALREHRGDGHVAALTAKGLSGCEPHRLMAAETAAPMKMFLDRRGWSEADWDRAGENLEARGFLEENGTLTSAGAEMRSWIEGTTDELAAAAYEAIGRSGSYTLLELLHPMAMDVARAEIIRFPNAMGLPRLGEISA